jgi:hypothetical protein
MERGSAHHAPRVDDELAQESAPILHGSVLGGRDREDLEPEAPTEEEQLAVPEPGGFEPGADVPAHADVLARSELARWLLPSAFPARAATLATVASKQGAPDEVVAPLVALPATRIFETVGELWEALGGVHEQRTAPEPEQSHAARADPTTPAARRTASPPPVSSVLPTDEPASPAEILVGLVTLPPRIALAAVRVFARALGRGISAITDGERSTS